MPDSESSMMEPISRTSRILRGVSLGYVTQALVMVTALWLTPFLLNRLGQEDYGLWLVGLQLLTYLTLVDFGIVALIPRETAFATGRAGSWQAAADLPAYLGQTTRLVLWQMPLVALVAIALWMWLPVSWSVLAAPLGVVLLTFVVFFPSRILQATLQGLQDLPFLAWVQIAAWIVSVASTVALVELGHGLWGVALGVVVAQAIASMSWAWRFRSFPGVLPKELPPASGPVIRRQLTQGAWVSAAQIAQVLLQGTDLVIIATVLGSAAVVPFVCTGKLIAVLANQPQMLMQAAGPALSELRASGARSRLWGVCSALMQGMLMVSGAVACVVLAANREFVAWWVGAERYGGGALTAALLVTMLLRHWNTTTVYAIFCFGYERRISVTTLLDGVVTVAAAIALVHVVGPLGAPLGSIIGVVVVSLPFNLHALVRETGGGFRAIIVSLWPWAWRFAMVAAGAAWLGRIAGSGSVWRAAVLAGIVGIAYLAVQAPLALQPPLGPYLVPRLAARSPRWLTRLVLKRVTT